ncbi:MAG: hypothetical protein J6I42_02410, partial [Clostridia bacterium]|nr:hypothetical protein [Clostridia bacterium]
KVFPEPLSKNVELRNMTENVQIVCGEILLTAQPIWCSESAPSIVCLICRKVLEEGFGEKFFKKFLPDIFFTSR